uniref:SH2 domain-containing protein n=1 Tax=Amazona collaria TaxID=241587 RepID=A0A8B9FL57_9PSIT
MVRFPKFSLKFSEALLLSNGQDGSYLLRKSNEREDLYSLSVRRSTEACSTVS